LNLRRWEEILADPQWHKVEGRIEIDRHGRVTVIPPLPVQHGSLEATVGIELQKRMGSGTVMVVCPVSTADGVRTLDVAWASDERWTKVADLPFFVEAPEICIEVVLPTDSDKEVREKIALFFDAGAVEVWTCDLSGNVTFFTGGCVRLEKSALCPVFPQRVEDD
jgi:Uma2 family endonuclease